MVLPGLRLRRREDAVGGGDGGGEVEPAGGGPLDLSAITGYTRIGVVAATTTTTILNTTAVANTKGAWVQLTAATADEATWIEVTLAPNSSGGRYMVDIGLGAAAAEVVLLPNLMFDSSLAANSAAVYRFPVNIPAGTRIAARAQGATTSTTIGVSITLGSGDAGTLAAPGSVQAYGVSTADSGGTQVDPGGVANTDSAWVELTASTSAAAQWLVIAFGHNDSAITTSARWLVDIATGAAASEVALISDLFVQGGSGEESPNPRTSAFALTIPAGTRIAVRARSSSIAATDRLLDVAVYLAAAE